MQLTRSTFSGRGHGCCTLLRSKGVLNRSDRERGAVAEVERLGRRRLACASAAAASAAFPFGSSGGPLLPAAAEDARPLCDDGCLGRTFGNFMPPNTPDEKEIFLSMDEESISLTYGTIRPKALAAILRRLLIRPADVVTDAGSGVGNIVLQVYATSAAGRIRGIEFVESRHSIAQEYLRKLEEKYPPSGEQVVEFVNGDLCEDDFSDSTIVFATNLLFGKRVSDCLVAACEANPRLRYLITVLPLANTSLRRIGEIGPLETSWDDDLFFQVYTNVEGTELLPP